MWTCTWWSTSSVIVGTARIIASQGNGQKLCPSSNAVANERSSASPRRVANQCIAVDDFAEELPGRRRFCTGTTCVASGSRATWKFWLIKLLSIFIRFVDEAVPKQLPPFLFQALFSVTLAHHSRSPLAPGILFAPQTYWRYCVSTFPHILIYRSNRYTRQIFDNYWPINQEIVIWSSA